MSEVKRFDPVMDAQEIYQVEGDVVAASDFDRVTAERDALQQRLTAANERGDVLETALRKIKLRLDSYAESDMRMPESSIEVCQSIADAALKPAERTNTSGKAHCPHEGICHTSNETCAQAMKTVAPRCV